ncbi:MAG: hypothetical protein J3R72DRAFT_447164 [Linnemannia gamsii]|nr:MAG: hypothetical protein J3R72DRAFT_447164 [Linnemannia gamsii]
MAYARIFLFLALIVYCTEFSMARCQKFNAFAQLINNAQVQLHYMCGINYWGCNGSTKSIRCTTNGPQDCSTGVEMHPEGYSLEITKCDLSGVSLRIGGAEPGRYTMTNLSFEKHNRGITIITKNSGTFDVGCCW